jgi:PKD repeat protein
VALVLTFSPAATAAAPPTIAVSATVTSDAAPVAFAASGDAVSYHWDFGDGGVADGASVGHVYRAGAFTARVTGTSAGGETATQPCGCSRSR